MKSMEGDQSTNSTQNIQKILLYFLQFSAILIGLYYAVLILIAFSGDFILLIQFIHIATGIVTDGRAHV